MKYIMPFSCLWMMIMFFPSVFLSLKLSVISFSGNKPKNLLKKLDNYVIYLVGYKAPESPRKYNCIAYANHNHT